jgi:hypothetical protein
MTFLDFNNSKVPNPPSCAVYLAKPDFLVCETLF